MAGAPGLEPGKSALEADGLPLSLYPLSAILTARIRKSKLLLRFFMRRMLTTPRAMLLEIKLFLNFFLIFLSVIIYPVADRAFQLHQPLSKFRL